MNATMDVATGPANALMSLQARPDSDILSPQLPTKRKRDESSTLFNGDMKANGTLSQVRSLQDMIADLVLVLQSQDTHAILSRPIEVQDDFSEPQPKRQRAESELAPAPASATVRAQVAAGNYKNTEDFLMDLERAADAVSKDLQIPQGSLRDQHLPLSKRETNLVVEIEQFKKTARDLIEREKALDEMRTQGKSNGPSGVDKAGTNGMGSKPVTHLTAKGDGKVVLTLYGNATNPKQLFSSLQKSVHETGVSQPLREVGLPNGITTTHIIPAKPLDTADDKKRVPTFGELFTSSNIVGLQPPKPSRHAASRGSVVGWYNPLSIESSKSRSSSYFGQPVSTGQWLEYNSASKSPESRRKRRERALSLSGKPPPNETDHEDDEVKQLESLFRSAYSSFAPTKDDSAAVASEGTVNRIWWQHVGEKSYERFLRNNEHLSDLASSEALPNAAESEQLEVNTDESKDEFDTWAPADAIDPSLQDTPAPKSIQDKEVEEVLKDISELLETLNSYQRIRNLSLVQHSRPAGSLSSTDPLASALPSKPSEGEQATYEILRSQLSIMISQLPPYAVAKLNSDQLADLSISTRIPIETEDYKGVMEEDEFSARAKVAAMIPPTSASRVPASTSYNRTPSTSSLYGNQYGTASRGGAVPAGSYYNQTPVRQTSAGVNNLPRASAPPQQQYNTQASYTQQRQTPSTGYRPPATATPTYPHQTSRLPQSYGAANTPTTYFQQTPQTQSHYGQNMGSSTHSGMAHSTPQAMMNGRYGSATHQNYQQRAPVAQNNMSYQYNASNIPRQTSPQKPPQNSYSPQPQLSQPQRNFGTPTPSQDPNRTYFQRPMSNGISTTQSYQPRPHQGSTSNNGVQNYVSAAGYATVMTEAEQGSILERNRRQLALQQGSSQHAARTAAQASAMGGGGQNQGGGGGNGQVSGSLAALVEFNKSAAS